MRASDREAYLSLPGLARFYAAGGAEVFVEAEGGADVRALQLNVVTAMLPFLLMQRGLLLLHGSAVSVNGRAYAFLGPSGAGKSSTAASLCGAGARLLVDDVVALDLSNDSPTLCPGFPQLKLFSSISERLGSLGVTPRTIHRLEEKQGLPLNAVYSPERQRLAGMYFLALGDEISIRPLEIPAMMRAVSCNPYINGLPPNAPRFLACARLAKQVPGFELTRSQTIDDLPQFTETLLNHICSREV